MSFYARPERDDALVFSSRWLSGEKRFQLALAFPVVAYPEVKLPEGMKWDLWYGKPYFLVLASVVSEKRWMGWLGVGKRATPQIEFLSPVLSMDGKKGWYEFSSLKKRLTHRVQFFPEAKSSRSEIEFRWKGGEMTTETHGGAFPLDSNPEAAFFFSRHYLVSNSNRSLLVRVFEHQNRMAWEAEKVSLSGISSFFPLGLKLETQIPEFTYFAKGSRFAEGLAQRFSSP